MSSNKINFDLVTLTSSANVMNTRSATQQGTVSTILEEFITYRDTLDTTMFFASSEVCNSDEISRTEDPMEKGKKFEAMLWKSLSTNEIEKNPYADAVLVATKLLCRQNLKLLKNNVKIRHRTPVKHNTYSFVTGEIDGVMHDTVKNEIALLEVKMTNGPFVLCSKWFLQLAMYALATRRALSTSRHHRDLPDAYLLVFANDRRSTINLLKLDWKRVAQLVLDKVPAKYSAFFFGLPPVINCVQVISKSMNKKLWSQKFDDKKKKLLLTPYNINYTEYKEPSHCTEPFPTNPVEVVTWKCYFPFGVQIEILDLESNRIEESQIFDDVRIELVNAFENEKVSLVENAIEKTGEVVNSTITPIPVYVQTSRLWKTTFNTAAEIYRRQKDPKNVAFAVLFETSNSSKELACSLTEQIIIAVELLSSRDWIQKDLVVPVVHKNTLCKIKGNPSFVIL